MNCALILKVGANLKDNQGLSPIFNDGTYEYIPSPLEKEFNKNIKHNHKHYSKLNCQNSLLHGMHLSSFVDEGTAHFDPEFYSFTYGETRKTHIPRLKELNDDDLLLFCASLQLYETTEQNFLLNGSPHLYVIGYFIIENAMQDILELKGPIIEEKLGNFKTSCNEHIIYKDQHIVTPEKKSLLLIQGDSHRSVFFKKPLRIAEECTPLPKYVKDWKMQKSKINDSIRVCLNYSQILNDLEKHGKNNHWTEWSIP
ncbi:hypothetical protein [Fluviispira sanaruensis]|uniref:Nucleotide modification associated domain-containing protein n=1 Tax=Fluviispira sanaruensis TaxID=2493639 RepID=A0A4P2VL60_FLUSA|nr:hypothetical protein [Fluviispira sanaruensis]BBH53561.1 hypothetical protein JCM31447_20050 [Fluviispira sanaruensis]